MPKNHGKTIYIRRHQRCLTQYQIKFSCQPLNHQNIIQTSLRIITYSQGNVSHHTAITLTTSKQNL